MIPSYVLDSTKGAAQGVMIIFSFFHPAGKAGGSQIRRCQGIAVKRYGFTLGVLALTPSGFCNVRVKLLIESGHECICLVCVNSIKDALEGIGCQFIIGDIQLKRRELKMKGNKVAWDIHKYNLMSEAGLRRTKRSAPYASSVRKTFRFVYHLSPIAAISYLAKII
jgi:hypothetical protein